MVYSARLGDFARVRFGGTMMNVIANVSPVIVFGASVSLFQPVPASAQDIAADMDAIRAATAKYADVNAALADGFIPDPSGMCVSAAAEGLPAEMGAMGIHYMNMARLGITAAAPRVDGNGSNTDFTQPSILLYEPQADGSMKLLGVENLVFVASWTAAGNSGAPVTDGQSWNKMTDDPATAGDEAHGFQPHYDLHIWTARDNPAGPMAPFNPAVTCPMAG
jgi:hypothetical protein